MYIVIGILAGIIILQFIIMWKYQRQVKDICRQLAFLMKHDSNMLINREFDMGGIGTLSDRLNELLELRRKEKQQYQEKETLIADTYTNLSHDIRTPLTSLDGYFQLMEECENVEDQKRYLGIIHERIHSLNEMLEELFTFTKLKNESYNLELMPCCINRIMKETVFSYYDDWVRMEIQPDIQITEEQLYIHGNRQGLRRVIQNVIKNGLDHGEKKILIGRFVEFFTKYNLEADWVVSAPETGFLFPSFDDRSTNLYNALYYTRDIGENHPDFVNAIFRPPTI